MLLSITVWLSMLQISHSISLFQSGISLSKKKSNCNEYSNLILQVDWKPTSYNSNKQKFNNPDFLSNDFTVKSLLIDLPVDCPLSQNPDSVNLDDGNSDAKSYLTAKCEFSENIAEILNSWNTFELSSQQELADKVPYSYFFQQWFQHGWFSVKTEAIKNCESYFKTVAKLFKDLQVKKTLEEHDITPCLEINLENARQIKSFNVFQNMPYLIFVSFDQEKSIYFLKTIYFCFDKNLKWIDCPMYSNIHPKEYVYLPDFNIFLNDSQDKYSDSPNQNFKEVDPLANSDL